MIKKIVHFFEKDIWSMPLKGKNYAWRFIIRHLRIFLLAFRGFAEDKVQLRASALTFYSLLSIVPILAMIFGIAKGFGFDAFLENYLKENLSQHQEILKEAIIFAERMLGRIKGGYIAGIGLVVLIWSVMHILGNIESSFNNIWQIKKSRGFSRKISDYISLVVIAPILVFISSSFTISQVSDYFTDTFLISYIGSILRFIFWVLSFSLIWFVFTLLYIVLPNTKVKFGSAFVGGIIAGTMFHLLQWGYVKAQVFLSGYGAIYGSFAAIPLFLMWLQYSWLIVLFGAEVAFASQNVENYEHEADSTHISYFNRRVLTMLVLHRIVRNFSGGQPAMTSSELADALDIPVRVVREIIYELLLANIVSETTTKNIKELAYQPAIDPALISFGYVLHRLDKKEGEKIHARHDREMEIVNATMEKLYADYEKAGSNKLLKEL